MCIYTGPEVIKMKEIIVYSEDIIKISFVIFKYNKFSSGAGVKALLINNLYIIYGNDISNFYWRYIAGYEYININSYMINCVEYNKRFHSFQLYDAYNTGPSTYAVDIAVYNFLKDIIKSNQDIYQESISAVVESQIYMR